MSATGTVVRIKAFLRREMKRVRRHLQKAGHVNAGDAIHDARKSVKKLRAALRLVGELTDDAAPRDAVSIPLREAAHRLGPLRDALVVAKTAKSLLKREALLPSPPAVPAAPLLQEARAQVRRAETRLKHLLKLDLDSRKLEASLRHLYRRARRAMQKAKKDGTDENLHAWRRRAKDYYYNLELLDAPSVKKIKRLTECLGDDHDLAFFARQAASLAKRQSHPRLFQDLKAKRSRLQKKAFRLGKTIFDHRPRKASARLLR